MADGEIQAPSISAIASLPSSDRFLGPDVLNRLIAESKLSAEFATRYCIVVSLVQLLNDEQIELVDLAYQTIRKLFGMTFELPSTNRWPRSLREQISLVGRTSTTTKPSFVPLSDLAKTVALDSDTTHGQWVSSFASFLASVLGRGDMFYVIASPVFAASAEYSSRLLPSLVKEALSQSTGSASTSTKAIISSYLQNPLEHRSVAIEIKKSIVDIVLHLRYSVPRNDSNPLAYNDWLSIDYLLLARAAILCRAYSTALLFLELGHETGSIDNKESENEILYSIYTNVEDPDGFYGIQSRDVRSSLVRRFHHEQQWDRAFAYHGADLRHGGSSDYDQGSSMSGVLQSLHSFGFDNMAASLFDHSRSGKNGQSLITTDLELDLAWRTGNWDLPLDLTSPATARTPEAALYASLKAIHRERDPDVVSTLR